MNRWNEIKYSFAFNILLPRFCLFVLIPFGILFVMPSPSAFPVLLAVLQPTFAQVVIASSLLLFGLSLVANLSVSRYLRRHQTHGSPYAYEAHYDPSRRSRYFRIQVTDKAAFRQLLDNIKREHPRRAIRFWLLTDDLVMVPPMLLLALFSVVFMLVPWLVQYLWGLFKTRIRHPIQQD